MTDTFYLTEAQKELIHTTVLLEASRLSTCDHQHGPWIPSLWNTNQVCAVCGNNKPHRKAN